jgi:hypothetical protein
MVIEDKIIIAMDCSYHDYTTFVDLLYLTNMTRRGDKSRYSRWLNFEQRKFHFSVLPQLSVVPEHRTFYTIFV